MLMNTLSVVALCLFYGMFAFAILRGKMVMRGFERVRTYFFFLLTIYLFLAHIYPLPLFSALRNRFWDVPSLGWVGMLLLYTGLAFYYVDAFQFRKHLVIGVDTESKELLTTGFYAKSRNPMYLSFITFWLGAFFVFPSWSMLLICLGEATFYHLQVVYKEEPFLRDYYGQAYVDYCQKVRRWF